jgi:hypothetical protein
LEIIYWSLCCWNGGIVVKVIVAKVDVDVIIDVIISTIVVVIVVKSCCYK